MLEIAASLMIILFITAVRIFDNAGYNMLIDEISDYVKYDTDTDLVLEGNNGEF